MIKPINLIKALYRANFYKSKLIRPGSFPEGYFMKESPLSKKGTIGSLNAENITFGDYMIARFKALKSNITEAMNNLFYK